MNKKLKQTIGALIVMILAFLCVSIGSTRVLAANQKATGSVSDQNSLDNALANTGLTQLTIKTDSVVLLRLDKVNRTKLNVIIDAPNATIVNCARLKKVTIKRAGAYIEYANSNTIEIAKNKSAALTKLTLSSGSKKTKLINSTGKAFEFTDNTGKSKTLAKGKKYTSKAVKTTEKGVFSTIEAKEIYLYGDEKVRAGQAFSLTYHADPSAAIGGVIFASSNEAVATVDNYGIVTGIGKGKTVITASAPNGVTGSLTVTVTDNAPALTYKLNSDKSGYIVTGCKDNTAYTVNIPAEYKNLPVKEVDAKGFMDCSNLRYFTTDSNQKYLYTEDGVLFCKSPVKTLVKFPNNYCDSLRVDETYAIPEGTVAIGDYAFAKLRYNNFCLHIPEGVQSIGNYAFDSSYIYASVYVPDSVTSIGTDIMHNVSGNIAIYTSQDNDYVQKYADEHMIPYSSVFDFETHKTDITTLSAPKAASAKKYKSPGADNIMYINKSLLLSAPIMMVESYHEDEYFSDCVSEVRLIMEDRNCWGSIIPDKFGNTNSYLPAMTGVYGMGYTEKEATLIGYDLSGNPVGTTVVKGDFIFAFEGAVNLGISGGKNITIDAFPYEPVFVKEPGFLNCKDIAWNRLKDNQYGQTVILCYDSAIFSQDFPYYLNIISYQGRDSNGKAYDENNPSKHYTALFFTLFDGVLMDKINQISFDFDKLETEFSNKELEFNAKASYNIDKNYGKDAYGLLSDLKKLMVGKYFPKKQSVSKITLSLNGNYPTTSHSKINLDDYCTVMDESTKETIIHEMVHAIDQSIPFCASGCYDLSVWKEGRAEYITEQFFNAGKASSNYPDDPDWSFISEDDRKDILNYMLFRQNRTSSYTVGYYFIKYLCEQYGDNVTAKIMADMAKIKMTDEKAMALTNEELRNLFSSCVIKETSKTVFEDFVRDVINR